MQIRLQREWEIAEECATPEHIFINRRAFVKSASAAVLVTLPPVLAACGECIFESDRSRKRTAQPEFDPTADLYPVPRLTDYAAGRPVTAKELTGTYNNFIEFGSFKRIFERTQALELRPWEIRIDGEVEKAFTLGIDELIRKMPLEERVYRHRCVEAWSMVVPWSGFPMRSLVELARPSSAAKYVRMETFHDPDMASGQQASWYPWPYVEGLTMAEAMNELAFMVTGVYGKPLATQFGAPLRLAAPWKYGFKSIKSIVRFSFTAERPKTFWGKVQGSEYGFWANVNPDVPHKRWAQDKERVLGANERVATRIYNGYGKWVADMYKELQGEQLFM